MERSRYSNDYQSPPSTIKAFPSLRFYGRMVSILYRAGIKAGNGNYTGEDWSNSSQEVGMAIESVGARIGIEGFSHVESMKDPCVFVANHMSTLETFFLPCIIQPVKDVTFVVKESLVKYPFLGPVLRSRDPLVVKRENPREDLAVVLDGGLAHLKAGRSVIIFPQGTRFRDVKAEQFSSLGVKLALKADVPVIPVALKTDAWGTGIIKDIGWIRPRKPIHIRFGAPVHIEGNGKEQHKAIVDFIERSFDAWSRDDD